MRAPYRTAIITNMGTMLVSWAAREALSGAYLGYTEALGTIYEMLKGRIDAHQG